MFMQIKRVPSWPKFHAREDGRIVGPSGRVLKAFPDPRGYYRVNYFDAGKWTQIGVHFLVCEAFHGPRPAGYHVAHGDGDRSNNTPRNLRWATPQENEADKIRHGTALIGERHHQAKLTEVSVLEIRRRRDSGEPLGTIATDFGVSKECISSITNRKTWRHL